MVPCYNDCGGYEESDRAEARNALRKTRKELEKKSSENEQLLALLLGKNATPEDVVTVKRILEAEVDRGRLLAEREEIVKTLKKLETEVKSLSDLCVKAQSKVSRITGMLFDLTVDKRGE